MYHFRIGCHYSNTDFDPVQDSLLLGSSQVTDAAEYWAVSSTLTTTHVDISPSETEIHVVRGIVIDKGHIRFDMPTFEKLAVHFELDKFCFQLSGPFGHSVWPFKSHWAIIQQLVGVSIDVEKCFIDVLATEVVQVGVILITGGRQKPIPFYQYWEQYNKSAWTAETMEITTCWKYTITRG